MFLKSHNVDMDYHTYQDTTHISESSLGPSVTFNFYECKRVLIPKALRTALETNWDAVKEKKERVWVFY